MRCFSKIEVREVKESVWREIEYWEAFWGIYSIFESSPL